MNGQAVHASEMEAEQAATTVGSLVYSDVVEGGRGLKVYDARRTGKLWALA